MKSAVMRVLFWAIAALLALVASSALWFYGYTTFAPRYHLLEGARIGSTRHEVVMRLGRPKNVAHSRAEFTGTDNWSPVPDIPVENEVLEYYYPPDWKHQPPRSCKQDSTRTYLGKYR